MSEEHDPVKTLILVSNAACPQVLNVTSSPFPVKVYQRPFEVMFAGPQVGPVVAMPNEVSPVTDESQTNGVAPEQSAFASIGVLSVVKGMGPVLLLTFPLLHSSLR